MLAFEPSCILNQDNQVLTNYSKTHESVYLNLRYSQEPNGWGQLRVLLESSRQKPEILLM